jgi:hypothetical protein
MLYRLYPQINQTRIFTEKTSRCKIPYCPAKIMKEQYPVSDFVIIGEIGNIAGVLAKRYPYIPGGA